MASAREIRRDQFISPRNAIIFSSHVLIRQVSKEIQMYCLELPGKSEFTPDNYSSARTLTRVVKVTQNCAIRANFASTIAKVSFDTERYV